MRALLIKEPWVGKILDGKKTWELRGSKTKVRETIALVASGSGTVIGVCDLVDCKGPLSARVFQDNAEKAGIKPEHAKLAYYKQTYAWVMAKPKRFKNRFPTAILREPSFGSTWTRLWRKLFGASWSEQHDSHRSFLLKASTWRRSAFGNGSASTTRRPERGL